MFYEKVLVVISQPKYNESLVCFNLTSAVNGTVISWFRSSIKWGKIKNKSKTSRDLVYVLQKIHLLVSFIPSAPRYHLE